MGQAVTQKRTIVALLSGAAGFALAFHREGQRQRHTLDPLKPHGRAKNPPIDQADRLGRNANSPTEIAPRGWWAVAKRTAQKFSENELMAEAAGVTFYALLSLFPAITAIVSLYGLFADRSTIEQQVNAISTVIPSGGVDIIRDQVHRLVQSPASGLSVGLIIGLLTALWSANAGTKAIFSALNDVYGERESRGFFRATLTSLAFTVGGIVFLLVTILLTVVLPKLFDTLGFGGSYSLVASLIGWPFALVALVAALAVLYRYGPSRNLARWQWVSWGGVFGALAWIGLSLGFSWYVSHFGSYNKTYGSLGAVVGFMTWIWLSTTVVLLGAQINAELETQTRRDSTVGAEKPLGTRGAASANTVA